MDRHRALALVLGLLLFLALLGSWFARIDKEDAAPTRTVAAIDSNAPRGPISEIVQVPRKASSNGDTVSYAAPIGPGVFRGRVVDAATREPIAEFTVELVPSVNRDNPPQMKRSFQAKDGRFVYRGLPTGSWTIFTTASGYQRFEMTASVSESEQAPEVLIPMRAGHSLRGRVVDEITNAGIASATISFREASTGRYAENYQHRPSVRARKDGSFALDGVPPGAVRLEVRAGGYVSREVDTFATDKTFPVEIALSKGAAVSGYLAGIDGLTPVEGEASLTNLDEHTSTVLGTGSDGTFTFSRLSAGRHLLAGRSGALKGQREVMLSHNEQLEGIVLPMTAGHSIRGVVSGLRPEERTETIVLAHAANSRNGMTDQTNLDERGAYEIEGVAPGQVHMEVISNRRGRLSRTVTMPADGDLTVNLEFKTGARLTGRITRSGKPLAGAVLHIRATAGDDEIYMQSTGTAANGDYVASDLPEGEYMLTVESYNSSRVSVRGDTVFDFDVPEVQLSGRVLEQGGNVPVVGAAIVVRPVVWGSRVNALMDRSDHFGQFGIRGLQPGDFVLSVFKPGYELYRASLAYGSPVTDMAIYMRPAQGVEIRVRDSESNQPIGSFAVIETINGALGLSVQLQADRNGVSYLPSGLAGSSLRILAFGYNPFEIVDWNGQQLDVSLQRESLL